VTMQTLLIEALAQKLFRPLDVQFALTGPDGAGQREPRRRRYLAATRGRATSVCLSPDWRPRPKIRAIPC